MSVTFGAAVTEQDTVRWVVGIWSDEAVGFVDHPEAPSFDGLEYQDAVAASEAWYVAAGLDWATRHEQGIILQGRVDAVEGVPTLNMANSNAREVLMALDLDAEDLCGREDADTFVARVLVALAADRLDDARPAWSEQGSGGATMLWSPRPAGYITERLERLLAIGEACRAAGRAVCWS